MKKTHLNRKGDGLMRKALWAALLGGVFLLMLSALVVTPQDEAPLQSKRIVPENAALCAMPQAAAIPAAQEAPQPARERAQQALPATETQPLPLPRETDANGRVLRATRYENCVYQVFRAGVAGG